MFVSSRELKWKCGVYTTEDNSLLLTLMAKVRRFVPWGSSAQCWSQWRHRWYGGYMGFVSEAERKKKQPIRDRAWVCFWASIAQVAHKPRGTETGEEGVSKSTWLLTVSLRERTADEPHPKIYTVIYSCLLIYFYWRGSNHRIICLQNLEWSYVTMRWVII